MKIFIIAQIMNGRKAVGYRLLDLDANNQVKDYTIPVIAQVLSNPATSDIIKNAKLINGEIVGTNGQLSRYAKVAPNGMLLGDSPLVVINKIDDAGYTVADFKGQVKKMKTSDVVEYAKNQGIANGKVVIQDNVEYISSISDSYEQISIAPSKVGKRGRVDLKIHIDSDARSIAKHTENDLDTELQYNDVFSAMSPEQRAILKQYYTWYTVDVYKGLAKNVRLSLAPGKAEKLAQLRGIDKWQFAGVNDSYLEARYNAKCELGHNLRYEYFAIPEDMTEGSGARTKEWSNYSAFRTTKGTQEELKERGAIVFGETCAGDFFNIAPEDMKKLVKTRKIMSDEIELMADIITNHMEDLFINKCKFLYDILRRLGTGKAVVDVFGQQIGYTLLSFGKANMPFPKSLVILAGDQIRKDRLNFYKHIIKGCDNTLDKIFQSDRSVDALYAIKDILTYITNYTVEGEYQYDPINDKECTRRDIGAYNKDTRTARSQEISRIISGTALKIHELESIDNIEMLIKMVAKSLEVCRYTWDYINNSDYFKETYNLLGDCDTKRSVNRLSKDLELFAENLRDVPEQKLPYINILNSCLAMDSRYNVRGYFNRRLCTFVDRYRSPRRYQDFNELVNTFQLYCMEPTLDVLMDNSLGLKVENYILEQAKLMEAELNKPVEIKIILKDDSDSQKLFGDKPCIKIMERKERELVESVVKGTYQGGATIELYGGLPIYAIDIKAFERISHFEYGRLVARFDNINHDEIMEKHRKEAEERRRKEEEERQKAEELAKAKERAEKEKRQKEFEADEKMQKLKELIDKHPANDMDYGISVARNIVLRGTPYKDLTSKQQWRVDETLRQLDKDFAEQSNTEIPAKSKLEDSPEVSMKVDKIMGVLRGRDVDAIQKVNLASRIAFDIARTIKYKGEFSEKQLKHINKAYDALK